ncbi:MAG TPA: carboxy terminal-processing peptidase [Deltaproteobacteria bacterium]|nr:carboxy terminal-processing peptidase [Deltaproteobacteria bacterium]HPR54998.1 carboxy terminal-processing peptidase [Deltaproteobacteria bacterium]HXK46335.1 carboxy terminal-processing peptidase [Deltaproteobacteria bacterium]
MNRKTRYIRIIAIVIAWFIAASSINTPLAASASLNPADYAKNITPLAEHSRVAVEIVRDLKRNHYRKVSIDNALSTKVFDRLLEDIDSSHAYFLASDIREFEPYRYRLDDGFLKGDMSPAFRIFNRYQERLAQRLLFIINLTDSGLKTLNLDKEEYFETDREHAPWPASRSELEDLWLKALKNEVINMRLEGKQMDEIAKDLSKRYWNQLKRLRQNTSEDVFQLSVNALNECYDPHTSYFSPRSSENFNINMSLSLEGIGAMLTADNEYTKVVHLVPGGPADKSNLIKTNDRIIGVGQGADGEIVDVVGWRLDDVVALIRGPKNTLVRLKIIPASASDEHQTKVIKLVRSTVRLEDQAAGKDLIEIKRGDRTYRIGVIHIPTFYLDIKAMQLNANNYKSTTRDVKRILEEFSEQKVDGVVIDLRDNGGGLLHEANTLTGLFIKSGPTVQIRSAEGDIETLYDRDPSIAYTGPLAVIISRLSASASEIFAGAIQDYGRGIIIGENSFGKGTVQTLLSLSRGQLKVTTSKFYRISGESTQHRGIIPDLDYPSMYDRKGIGESTLKEALPWDVIGSVPHFTFGDLSPYKPQLKALYKARIQKDPDYTYTLAMNDYLEDARAKTKVSLRLSTRIKEKQKAEEERLTLENRLRKAKGEKPVTSVDDLDEDKEDPDAPRTKPAKDDAELVEGGNVLVDYITIKGRAGSAGQ